ncbi:MAG: hypothetical protein R3B95_21000 [Nitrospirales bacterium]|nr:hypothetical protein [Nitrospirales bacterium]
MTMKEFQEKHGSDSKSITEVIDRWVLEKEIDDFLGTRLFGGFLISDLLKGDELVDSIPDQVKEGFKAFNFKELLGVEADTPYKMKLVLLAKAQKNVEDNSLVKENSWTGLRSKIQGQIGENEFKNSVGDTASLAPKGNQRGWDVKINHPSETQYVQVKVYEEPGRAIKELKQLQDELSQGLILDGGKVVKKVDFAVNDDIFEEVKQKASELGIPATIKKIGATHKEITSALETARENVVDSPLNNFFEELLGGACTGAALHAAVNGFLVWKGAKEKQAGVEDTVYSSAITGGGIGASFASEAILSRIYWIGEYEHALAVLASPIGGLVHLGVGFYARGVLKRLADRRHVARRLSEGNRHLSQLIARFA